MKGPTAHHVKVEHLAVGHPQVIHGVRIVRVVHERPLVVCDALLQVALQFDLHGVKLLNIS